MIKGSDGLIKGPDGLINGPDGLIKGFDGSPRALVVVALQAGIEFHGLG